MLNSFSKSEPSLKSRAVAYLSRREHSRLELKRKLAKFTDDENEIEAVLDSLQEGNWQSDERYAFAYAQRNSIKHGINRIINDLRQQGIADKYLNDIAAEFSDSEYQRALNVWQKKFNTKASDQREYAKQFRFMASRGFSADYIHSILAGKDID